MSHALNATRMTHAAPPVLAVSEHGTGHEAAEPKSAVRTSRDTRHCRIHLVLLTGASSGRKRRPSWVAVIKLVIVAVERPGSVPSPALAVPCHTRRMSACFAAALAVMPAVHHPEVVEAAGV